MGPFLEETAEGEEVIAQAITACCSVLAVAANVTAMVAPLAAAVRARAARERLHSRGEHVQAV